jgi:alanine racemase
MPIAAPADPAPRPPAPLPPPASLRLRIDREALAHNWQALDALSAQARAGAAIKADAYGLGVAHVAPVLRAAGCQDFFVAHWSELARVLPLLPPRSVSVLHGPITAAEAAYGKAIGARPVINSLPQAARWLEAGGGRCDLMIDTGINRLGLPLADLGDPLLGRLDIDICMSHLASADQDSPHNEAQRARFAQVRGAVRARRYSLANSAGIALGPAYHADLTRPGLSLYGGVPRPELAGPIRQVVWPETVVIQVRRLSPGDRVGYNGTFVAPRAMRAGVVALGYADGYLRSWTGKGRFIWNGMALPSLGRISMDMTVVDLSRAPDCGEGDWLGVAYDPVAADEATGLSQYELFTLLGRRFDRV